MIDYVQMAIHLHATVKLLTVPVGVTDTECMRIVPELTSKQDTKSQGRKAGAVTVEAEPAASLPALFPLWRAHLTPVAVAVESLLRHEQS